MGEMHSLTRQPQSMVWCVICN